MKLNYRELLKASKGLPVKDPVAALWGRLNADWPITEITGTLPLHFKSRVTSALKNYLIFGTAEGAGVETENLVIEVIQNASVNAKGTVITSNIYNASIAPVTAGTTYTLSRDYTGANLYYAFFTDLPAIGSVSYNGSRVDIKKLKETITAPITGYVVVLNKEGKSTVAEGNTAIPYGYKITLTANDTEVPIYIGESQLMANECVDYQKQKVCKTPVARWECSFFPVVSPEGIDFIHFTLNWYMLNNQKITTCARMYLPYEVVNPLTEDTPNVIVQESVMPTAKKSGGTGGNVRGDTGCSIRAYLVYNDTKYYSPTFNFTTDYVKKKGTINVISYSYEDEVTPPSPLPTIVAYEGETTLSSTETVGEVTVTVKGRIREVTT